MEMLLREQNQKRIFLPLKLLAQFLEESKIETIIKTKTANLSKFMVKKWKIALRSINLRKRQQSLSINKIKKPILSSSFLESVQMNMLWLYQFCQKYRTMLF